MFFIIEIFRIFPLLKLRHELCFKTDLFIFFKLPFFSNNHPDWISSFISKIDIEVDIYFPYKVQFFRTILWKNVVFCKLTVASTVAISWANLL